MKLLLHICCANCALYPITTLNKRGFAVTGLWYNPNIHPVTEYNARLDALKELQKLWQLSIYYKDVYGLTQFIKNTADNPQKRCLYCYNTRLEECAKFSKENGFDAFSTTLLYSIYQKYYTIVEIGKLLETKYNIQFYEEDFRDGWQEGINMSKELLLYRQKYCGCLYSEKEKKKKKR
ncbi:MAG: epoxyqueuosine reductase QueH [Candidatus Magnetoovum sp. WYHC-5]|nr:epoxyqueuosine reductase QueH [Candidatus Magnetoovum sp. WYHC-5]